MRTTQELRFGRFQLFPSERRLLFQGQPVAVGARALDVLLDLVTHNDRIRTKDELLGSVWDGVVVEENTLQAQISALRKVLGTEAIATVSGRGYRFVMPIDERQVVAKSFEAPFPAALSAASDSELQVQFSVPGAVSSFVGRQRELGDIASRIRSGARLLTVTGPGGSGKTRVAMETGNLLRFEHPDGIFWVDLESATSADGVIERISRTVGVKGDLAQWIGSRELLLLLDNFEQAITGAPELAGLLSKCPRLRCLVTSRELLRVRGEVEYALPPLVPEEAVSLFCERAQVMSSEAIERLCDSLDNMPLALELAAARMKAISAESLLRRLPQGLDLLKGGRDAIARHRSLRSAIDWSFEALSEEERSLFVGLSVFSGGWTLESAEEVAGAKLDCLQSLVEKNLIRHRAGRYSMLQMLKQYAAEHLRRWPNASGFRDAHARYFAALASNARAGVRRDAGSCDVLRADLDNFLAALDWLSERGLAELQLELAVSLGNLWYSAECHAVATRVLQRALDATSESALTRQRARALRMLGDISIECGDYHAAQLYLEEALGLFENTGALKCISPCFVELGIVSKCIGDAARAKEFFAKGIDVARAQGDKGSLAWALLNYGELLVDAGDLALAEAVLEESLSSASEDDDEVGVAGCHFNLGRISLLKGESEQGLRQLRASLCTFATFGAWTAATHPMLKVAETLATIGRERDATLILGSIVDFLARYGVALKPSQKASMRSTLSIVEQPLGADLASQLSSGRATSLRVAAELALR